MKLISHADDFGLEAGITAGTKRAAELGRLTELSVIVNGHLQQTAHNHWQLPKNLLLGLHFNLTEGRPISAGHQVPHLVDHQGRLYPWPIFLGRLWAKLIPRVEMEIELAAQLAAFADLFGQRPSHLDSHHHIHLTPPVWSVVCHVAQRERMTLRQTRHFIYGPKLDPRPWLAAGAFARIPEPCSGTFLEGLVDVRWLPQKTLAQTVAQLDQEGRYELLWHLDATNQFAWRAKQQRLIEDPMTWSFLNDQSAITLETYQTLTEHKKIDLMNL